ncbi:MAG: TolC family protein [Bacteroidetes bacterium]|nr:TolC family protein [Bacteroidota bacterium]
MIRFLLIFLIAVPALCAQGDESLKTLDDIVAYAMTHNADLAAMDQRIEAARHRVPQAGSLMDPKLTIGLMNLPVNSFSFTQEPMTGKQLGLMQSLPFPGKLDLREKIADQDVAIGTSNLHEMRNEIRKAVKIAYAEWYYIERTILTTSQNLRVLEDMLKIVESKYSVGKGLQQDVLKANVEITRLQERLVTLKQSKIAKRARLNGLLNRPADADLPLPILPPVFGSDITNNEAIAWADSERPLLRSFQAYIDQSDLKTRLARKDTKPDFDLGISYSQRQRLDMTGKDLTDFLSITLSINLPVYASTKQDEKIRESVALSGAWRNQYVQFRSQIEAMISDVLSALEKNKTLISLYRTGLIPQATESLNSNFAGYTVDKIDFLTLIQSQVTLFNVQLEEHRLISDYFIKLAELEFVTGHRLD